MAESKNNKLNEEEVTESNSKLDSNTDYQDYTDNDNEVDYLSDDDFVEEEKEILADEYEVVPDGEEDVLPHKQKKSYKELQNENRQKQAQEVNRILKGKNDVFYKEYDYPEIRLKFSVSIKAPTIGERGLIEAQKAQYLGGMSNHVSFHYQQLFKSIAILNVVGIQDKLPKYLRKSHIMNFYREDVIMQIGEDFQLWLSRFHL